MSFQNRHPKLAAVACLDDDQAWHAWKRHTQIIYLNVPILQIYALPGALAGALRGDLVDFDAQIRCAGLDWAAAPGQVTLSGHGVPALGNANLDMDLGCR